MKIERHMSKWGHALYFGPYIEWQDWNILHHSFEIGFYIGPWIFFLSITLWDIEQEVLMLKDHGMTDKEAWDFCDAARENLPDPYDSRVNMRKVIERELTKLLGQRWKR